ncbi:hypothetical protein [Flavobacterium sp. LB2R40]|uniref:hypothetical protein n=1 Tax=Flavobacterium sp. LB2R40 TaxID=3401722 RepID=UPI003AB0CB56
MKFKILFIVIIISTLSGCNSSSSKEKINVFDGTYQITESGLVNGIGVWVFSKNEISIFHSTEEENSFANLGLSAVVKYYIKDDYIYECSCILNDCSYKGKNFEKDWKIESINQTNSKRIIILTSVKDTSYKIKLEKDKDLGLDVIDK